MSVEKIKLLLVEDDTSMGFLLADFLESNGFEVGLFRDGISGWEGYRTFNPEFCVLDVMLPGMDGFKLAEKIRELNPSVPVIFLTARALKVDKIKGFALGVDDYITKPFDEDELLCRIHAILNRIGRKTNEQAVVADLSEQYEFGAFLFDYPNQLLWNGKESRRLTQKESEVLRILCRSINNIVKRDELLLQVWGNNDYFNGRSLDVFITKLRKYLQVDTSVVIENIPKVGFVLNA
jgi:DNA-binding response OmpR family regulator